MRLCKILQFEVSEVERSTIRRTKLKSNRDYGALLIEMKKKGGYQSPSQKQWQKMICENREYKYVVCHSLDDFIREVDEFLKNAELWDEM